MTQLSVALISFPEGAPAVAIGSVIGEEFVEPFDGFTAVSAPLFASRQVMQRERFLFTVTAAHGTEKVLFCRRAVASSVSCHSQGKVAPVFHRFPGFGFNGLSGRDARFCRLLLSQIIIQCLAGTRRFALWCRGKSTIFFGGRTREWPLVGSLGRSGSRAAPSAPFKFADYRLFNLFFKRTGRWSTRPASFGRW